MELIFLTRNFNNLRGYIFMNVVYILKMIIIKNNVYQSVKIRVTH